MTNGGVYGQTVIYSDSFNRTTGSSDINGLPADPNNYSDWGMNDNALGGTVQQTWFVGPTNRTGGANQSTDGDLGGIINGGTMFDFDVTTVALGGFSVGFDFSRFHPINPGTGNGFVAFGFGRTVPADPDTYGPFGALNIADFVVLFQQGSGAMSVTPNSSRTPRRQLQSIFLVRAMKDRWTTVTRRSSILS